MGSQLKIYYHEKKEYFISLILVFSLSSTTFANETNPLENNETRNELKNETNDSVKTIKYYGERAGLFRPCGGECVLVCKEITISDRLGTAIVSDGEKTIVVDIKRINFEDGSVDI